MRCRAIEFRINNAIFIIEWTDSRNRFMTCKLFWQFKLSLFPI